MAFKPQPMQVLGYQGSPRDAAINNMQSKADYQAKIGSASHGGRVRRRHHHKYFGGQVVVPYQKPLYNDTLAGNQSTAGQTSGVTYGILNGQTQATGDSAIAPVPTIPPNQLKGGRRKKPVTRKHKKSAKRSKSRKHRKSQRK
jgi:hypothetical protein